MKFASARIPILIFVAVFILNGWPLSVATAESFKKPGILQIHYINVGQGGSTLIIGPDGTTILYDFGQFSGDKRIVPYLVGEAKLLPQDGLDYTIVSHADSDHYHGFKEVIEAGYDVRVANYRAKSQKRITAYVKKRWITPAEETSAGAVKNISVGMKIPLGEGAEVLVAAAGGRIIGRRKNIKTSNENDRSVALLIRYKNFQYILDGDLGGGSEKCSGHRRTGQKDMQSKVALALIAHGAITQENGVDVLHIAHHGSESSTPERYYKLMKPEVGLVSVGFQANTYTHPRMNVVENVLIGKEESKCKNKAVPVEFVFQTEEGQEDKDCKDRKCISKKGLVIGDIQLFTDGEEAYTIRGTGWTDQEGGAPEAEFPRGAEWRCSLDEMEGGGRCVKIKETE